MKALLLLPLFMLGFGAPVGAAMLNGIVLVNELGGQPLENVELDAQGANTTVSLHNGRFSLDFGASMKAGDEVQLTARKEGYAVVHYILLHQVLRSDPEKFTAEILMCKEGDQDEMARRFFRLKGDEAVEANYQDRLHALEAENRASAEAVKQLQAERDSALGAARKAADDFATQKAGQASEMYDRAMRFFLDRKLDDALNVLDEAALERQKAEAKQTNDRIAREYDLRAQLLVLKFDFPKATEAYQSAVEASPDNFDAQFALANFLQSLNRLDPALVAYQRCLELAQRNHNEAEILAVLNNRANLHYSEHQIADARQAYEAVLGEYRKLAKLNPEFYQPRLATTLNNLGNLNGDEHQMADARSELEEALRIRRTLADKNPDAYSPDLAVSLNNLGTLDRTENRISDARQMDEEALKIRVKLAEQNPAYLPDLAQSQNNLGILDWIELRMADAHKEFDDALRIRGALAKENPDTYLPDVAATLVNIGILDWSEKRMADSHKAFDEALGDFRKLAEQNPRVYLPEVAKTLNNVGILDGSENRMADARKAFGDALDIYTKFAAIDPARFAPEVTRENALLKSLKN